MVPSIHQVLTIFLVVLVQTVQLFASLFHLFFQFHPHLTTSLFSQSAQKMFRSHDLIRKETGRNVAKNVVKYKLKVKI